VPPFQEPSGLGRVPFQGGSEDDDHVDHDSVTVFGIGVGIGARTGGTGSEEGKPGTSRLCGSPNPAWGKLLAEHNSDSTPSSTGASNKAETKAPEPKAKADTMARRTDAKLLEDALAVAKSKKAAGPTAANIAGPLRQPDVIDVSDEEEDVWGAAGGMQGRGVVPR
jgi:hypothetical protein